MTSSRFATRFRSIEAAAVAGLVFAVTSVIAMVLLSSSPDLSAQDSEIVVWYSDAANRALLTTGLSLSIVSSISFLWFVAVIRRRVGDREDQFFATVFLGSGVLLTAIMLTGTAALATPAITADLANARIPDASTLNVMSGFGTTLILVVLLRIQAVFVVSTSTLALRSGAFSRWLSYLGYAIALVMFFMPILTEPVGLAFPIWVGILSIALLARRTDIIGNTKRP
jgi:hypothetical protein